MENILQNCSDAFRASSSQYYTCSALHRRSQGVQPNIQNKLSLTPRVGQLDATDSGKRTSDPCAQFLLLTGAPGCPIESATGSRQCNSLQCSLVHGSGRLESYSSQNKTDVPEGRGDRTAKTNKEKTNEFRDKSTSKCDGREEVTVAGVCVCVMLWPAVLCSP